MPVLTLLKKVGPQARLDQGEELPDDTVLTKILYIIEAVQDTFLYREFTLTTPVFIAIEYGRESGQE